jgi:hypothetical protein
MSAGSTYSLGALSARGCSSTKASTRKQIGASEHSQASAHFADVQLEALVSNTHSQGKKPYGLRGDIRFVGIKVLENIRLNIRHLQCQSRFQRRFPDVKFFDSNLGKYS